MKKIIYFLLTTFVLSLVSALPIYAEEEAIDDRIQVVIDLGIVSGDGSGDYNLDGNITRAEMATVVYQLKYGDTEAIASKDCFYDVPQNHWAAGYIEVLYSNNIISGDGTGYFRPSDNVTTAELYTMLLKIAGYSDYMKTLGTYPDNVEKAATGSGLNKNIGNLPNEVITRGDAFVALYNLLNVNVLTAVGKNDLGYTYENGPIFMNEQLEVYKDKGTVDGAQNTAYDGSYLPDGVVTINGEQYKNEADITIDDMGLYGEFYYSYTDYGTKVVLSFIPTRNDVIEITSAQIVDYDSNKYTYKDGSKTKEAKLKAGKNIYYNGYTVLGETYMNGLEEVSYMEPSYGKVKLIDNDGDKIYDTVFVEEYQNMISSYSSESTNTIHGTIAGEDVAIDLSVFEEYSLQYEDGSEVMVRNIPENTLLMLQYYNEGTCLKIIVHTNVIEGTITAIDYNNYNEKVILVDGKEYAVASSNAGGINEFRSGASVKVHLDCYGKIGAIEKVAKLSGWKFGIILEVDYDKKVSEYARVTMLTKDGIKQYTFYDRLRIDSSPVIYTPEMIEEQFNYTDVVRFTHNSSNQILRVDRPTPKAISDWTGSYAETDTLLERSAMSSKKFKTTNMAMYIDEAYTNNARAGEAVFYDADTLFLQIPHPNEVDRYDETKTYKVTAASNLSHNTYYNMAAYNTDPESITADLVVRYVSNNTMPQSASSMIVDKVTQVLNEDDEITYQVSGYLNGIKVKYNLEKPSMVNVTNNHVLQRGDIVRIKVTNNEIVNMVLVHSINDPNVTAKLSGSATQYGVAVSNGVNDWEHASKYEYGYIELVQNPNIVFKRGNPEADYPLSYYNAVKYFYIYIYDESSPNGEVISVGTLKDIKSRQQYPSSYDNVILGAQSANGTDLFLIRR